MSTALADPILELQKRHRELHAAEPGLRMRDRAARLGVREAELVAAQCGVGAIELVGDVSAPMQSIFRDLGSLGRVVALSRNDWCVHERHGVYTDIQADAPVGLVLGADIDLRMFFQHWRYCYAVTERGRISVQFFDRAGDAVHKVYLTEDTSADAYAALLTNFASSERRLPEIEIYPPVVAGDAPDDPCAFRAAWLAMTDTHDFIPLLRRFDVSRLGALRAVGNELAREVGGETVELVLRQAAATSLPIMCFVANRGIVQIHTGPIKNLQRTGPWYNVLDPSFNLHLNTSAVASSWIVAKPTVDGWVTSLELFADDGSLIVQFFGARKPGRPELSQWRALLTGVGQVPAAL